MLPGLLKNLNYNKNNKLPFKFFELGDVILLEKVENRKDENEFIGAKNNRRLAVVYANTKTSGLDIVHGVLDVLFTKVLKNKKSYVLKKNNSPYFLYNL